MSNFKKMFQRYKNNKASEEEVNYIEEEIEKNTLINEFIDEQYDDELGLTEDDTIKKNTRDENINGNTIKRAVNKKLNKVIAISVILVFLTLGLSKYVVSPIVSNFYYNPEATSMGTEYMGDMQLDLIAQTELTMPGIYLHHIIVDNLGYGKYKCYASFLNSFNRNSKDMQFSMKRNKLIGDYSYLYDNESFTWGLDNLEEVNDESKQKRFKDIKDEIAKLPSTSYIDVSVIPENKLGMDSIRDLGKKYAGQVDIYWVAVATNNPVVMTNDKGVVETEIGFNPNLPSITYRDFPDKEKYPLFFLKDYYMDGLESEMSLEEGMSQHFKSLLKYAIDREEFFKLFKRSQKIDKFSEALNYVEQNGVEAYKLYIKGTNGKVLEFINNENMVFCEIKNVKASKYTK
ncbi:hypothetical protein AN1V17_06410 [Vallitalea sediminicola]